jgi:hypothetical protein
LEKVTKWTIQEKPEEDRTGEFILFAVFRAFEALKKKSSLDFLFLLGQAKRKAENNNPVR